VFSWSLGKAKDFLPLCQKFDHKNSQPFASHQLRMRGSIITIVDLEMGLVSAVAFPSFSFPLSGM
jgi:hypothetical protein